LIRLFTTVPGNPWNTEQCWNSCRFCSIAEIIQHRNFIHDDKMRRGGRSMAIPVVMPRLEPGMTEGTILKWEKNVGDMVEEGERLLRIESETTEADVAAPAAGCLLKLEAETDQIVACGEVIAWLGQKEEKAADEP
jgi:acetyl/propionyl-CoA carboxylase alpha subunit